MKTTRILVMALFLITTAACSKQDNTAATSQAPNGTPMEGMSEMDKSEAAKPTVMLPNEMDPKDMSGTNVEQDASGKKVLYWEDPMVPNRHFSKSGQSPFMDMKLSPKYAE